MSQPAFNASISSSIRRSRHILKSYKNNCDYKINATKKKGKRKRKGKRKEKREKKKEKSKEKKRKEKRKYVEAPGEEDV